MDDQLNDINLLPDEIRKEEEKRLASRSDQSTSSIKSDFHIPQPSEPVKTAPKTETDQTAPQDVLPEIKEDQEELPPARKFEFKPKRRLFGWPSIFKKSKAPPLETKKAVRAKVNSHSQNILPPADSTPPTRNLLDVNLIPEGTYLLPTKTILSHLFNGILIGVILAFFGYLGLIFYGNYVNQQDLKLAEQIESKKLEFQQYDGLLNNAEQWNRKATVVESLFDKHVFLTQVLQELEAVTIPDVYYANISLSINSTINLAAMATSYTAVARQYLAYLEKPEIFDNVEIGGLSGDSDSSEISFTVTLKLNPAVFFTSLAN